MKTRILIAIAASLIFCVGLLLPAFGQEMKPIKLPEPKLDQSKSLVHALKERKTQREYSSGQEDLRYQQGPDRVRRNRGGTQRSYTNP